MAKNKTSPFTEGISSDSPWRLYIVECRDGSLYTGITNNLDRRLGEHNAGRASRYTRGRLPVKLLYEAPCLSRSDALIQEGKIKALSRTEKKKLIAGRKRRRLPRKQES